MALGALGGLGGLGGLGLPFQPKKKPPVPTMDPTTGQPTPVGAPQYGSLAGVQTQPFGPESNLIGTQFTPPTGPDRGALAAQTFQQLTDASAPQYQQDLRSVGQRAAQYGRIGSGVTTSELGDVALQRQKYLGNLAAQLATQSAGQTLADRQLTYQDLLGERGYQQGTSQQAFDNALAAAGLTQPSTAALGIGEQYGANAQGAYAGTGNLLMQLLQQYGPKAPSTFGSPTYSGTPAFGPGYA